MKPITFFLLWAWLPLLFAQAPQGINYQAIARNTDGTLLANTAMLVVVELSDDINNTNTLFREEHANQGTNQFGLLNLILGGGNPLLGVFQDIDWSDGPYYLTIRLRFNNDIIVFPTVPFQSVPYALFAENAGDRIWNVGNDNQASYEAGRVGIGTNQPQSNLEVYSNGIGPRIRIHHQSIGFPALEFVRGNIISGVDWRIENNNDLIFATSIDNFTTSPFPNFWMTSGGNASFGTNLIDPPVTFSAVGNDERETIRVQNRSSSNTSIASLELVRSSGADYRILNDAGQFRIERGFGGTATPLLTFNSGSNNLNMQFHRIVDLADPTAGDHAVTLSYLNDALDELTANPLPAGLSPAASSQMNIAQCATYCRTLNLDGNDDWKIPSIEDYNYYLNPSVSNNFVWTSTPTGDFIPGTSVYTYYIVTRTSGTAVAASPVDTYSCRCVR